MENKPTGPNQEQLEKAKNASVKTLAVLGLIAVLALLSIGIIRIAPGVIRAIGRAAVSLSEVFIPAQKVALNADRTTAASGEIFNLNWDVTGENNEGSFTLSYPCQNGVHLESVLHNRNDVLFCNTPYSFLNEGNRLSLIGVANVAPSNGYVEVPVTLHFTRNGETKETAHADITMNIVTTGGTVSNGQPSVSPSVNPSPSPSTIIVTPTPSPIYKPTPTPGQTTNAIYPLPGATTTGSVAVSNPYGYIDLTARVLETGSVDKVTGVFTPKAKVKFGDRAAIRFEIVNLGTKTVSDWTFAAVLPTFPSYIFQSETQRPLGPGDKIQYTLGFDSIMRQPENTFTINVDPIGSVNESTKGNNIIKDKIYVDMNN